MGYCPDCGSKSYGGACTNCHEEMYIAEQHMELDTWDSCSEEFKNKVVEQENEVANNRRGTQRSPFGIGS